MRFIVNSKLLFQFWVLLNLKVISIPVLSIALYRKCYVALTGLGLLLAASYGLRAVGRSTTEAYVLFLKTLNEAHKDMKTHKVAKGWVFDWLVCYQLIIFKLQKLLQRFDFDFSAWPIEFKWNDYEV